MSSYRFEVGQILSNYDESWEPKKLEFHGQIIHRKRDEDEKRDVYLAVEVGTCYEHLIYDPDSDKSEPHPYVITYPQLTVKGAINE